MKTEHVVDFKRQQNFSDLSGDHNPLHVNIEFSRRTRFSELVVHGMHLVFLAIENLQIKHLVKIVELTAEFRSAITVGSSFTIETESIGNNHVCAIVNNNKTCAKFRIVLAKTESQLEIGSPGFEKVASSDNF